MTTPRRTLLGILAERQDRRRGYVLLPDVNAPADVLPPSAAILSPPAAIFDGPPPPALDIDPADIAPPAMGSDPGRYVDDVDDTDGPGTHDPIDLMSTVVMAGRADIAGRLAVVANAIGYEMLRHDGRACRLIDGVAGIDVTAREAERCRAAAAVVLDHLAAFALADLQAQLAGPANGRRWVVQWDDQRGGSVVVLGPGFPSPSIEVVNGESFDARMALGHEVARHLNGAGST